jgi:3-hydroxyacyl-CoA dehydrogenase/enoyl-CoA hydratase/3-hydroxybutyryl-CoA epimerase
MSTTTSVLTIAPRAEKASVAMAAALTSTPASGFIRRDVTDDNVCVLTFDRPESTANIFDRATLLELNSQLNWIVCNANLKGLVLASEKNSIFIAGADLQSLSKAKTREELREIIELGQSVFNRIAALGIPTIAAIHGACVGGGLEICLACDSRIASADNSTKIGLPETMLGILPAWGGCTRLPRLIGLPKALDVILGGKTLAAKPAMKCGMIDDIVPREYLVQKACERIQKEGHTLGFRKRTLAHRLASNLLTARVIANRVEARVLKETRGHYPAPIKALQVVTQGMSRTIEESLALERDAILDLVQTDACKNLIRVFFLQERAKKLPGMANDLRPQAKVDRVKRIAVIGAGVMGAGIAQWASSRDVSVILRDISAEAIADGMIKIANLYDRGVKRFALTKLEARTGLDRITPSADDVPLRSADIVIEAAVEKMELKKRIFEKLDELAGPKTILASNTSALSITDLSAATRHLSVWLVSISSIPSTKCSSSKWLWAAN